MIVTHPDIVDGRIIEWRWPNFTPWEIRSDRDEATREYFGAFIHPEAMDRLQRLRALCGFPIIITSAYRSPAYNRGKSKTGSTGPHTTGRAFDILIYGHRAFELRKHAMSLGFTGIGEKQHGPHAKRMMHIDDLPNGPGCPRPWSWTYP